MKSFAVFLRESTQRPYFHGTSSSFVKGIREQGLRPGSGIIRSTDMTMRDTHEDVGVYITTDFAIAVQESVATVTGVDKWWNRDDLYAGMYSRRGQPAIVVLDPSKVGLVTADSGYEGGHAYIAQSIPPAAVIDVVNFRLGQFFDWAATDQAQFDQYIRGSKMEVPHVKLQAVAGNAHRAALIVSKHNLAAFRAWVEWRTRERPNPTSYDNLDVRVTFDGDFNWKAVLTHDTGVWEKGTEKWHHTSESHELGHGSLADLDDFLSATLTTYPAPPPRDIDGRRFRSGKQLLSHNVRELSDPDT